MSYTRSILATAGLTGLLAVGAVQPLAAQEAAQVLRVGMGSGDIGKMDPHVSAGTPEKMLFGWLFDGLVRLKPGESNPEFIEPALATSWEHSPDNLVWTFTLRQGVQCHGKYGEFTAEDAAFSLKRAADPSRSSFSSDFSSLKSVEAVDDYTLRIEFSERVPSVLGLLVNLQGGNMVCKDAVEDLGDGFAQNPIGTGPFMFKSYEPQQQVVLEANPDYYLGKPKVDRIEYKFIPAIASRDLAFQNGELDITFGQSDKNWYDRMKAVPGASVIAIEPAELYTLHLNMAKPPLNDPKVRKAIAHALPRDGIVQYRGESVARAAPSVVPQGYLGHSADTPLPDYDVAKAKALLAEAGHPDGITLTVVQTSLPVMRETMEVIQGQLRKAGITVDLQIVEHATFHADIRQDKSDMVLYAAARFPVADTYLTQFYDSKSIVGTDTAVTNFSHCDVADSEIRQARVEADAETQRALWAEAQKKIAEAVCAIPVYEALQVWAISDRVTLGYEPHGSLQLGLPVTEATTVN